MLKILSSPAYFLHFNSCCFCLRFCNKDVFLLTSSVKFVVSSLLLTGSYAMAMQTYPLRLEHILALSIFLKPSLLMWTFKALFLKSLFIILVKITFTSIVAEMCAFISQQTCVLSQCYEPCMTASRSLSNSPKRLSRHSPGFEGTENSFYFLNDISTYFFFRNQNISAGAICALNFSTTFA